MNQRWTFFFPPFSFKKWKNLSTFLAQLYAVPACPVISDKGEEIFKLVLLKKSWRATRLPVSLLFSTLGQPKMSSCSPHRTQWELMLRFYWATPSQSVPFSQITPSQVQNPVHFHIIDYCSSASIILGPSARPLFTPVKKQYLPV